jgi:hypothetical protein
VSHFEAPRLEHDRNNVQDRERVTLQRHDIKLSSTTGAVPRRADSKP